MADKSVMNTRTKHKREAYASLLCQSVKEPLFSHNENRGSLTD